MRVFDLSLGEMLWSRRTVFMALVVGLPVLLAIVVRAPILPTIGVISGASTTAAAATGRVVRPTTAR